MMNLNISPDIIITTIIGIILLGIIIYLIRPSEKFNNKSGCKLSSGNNNIILPKSENKNVENLSTDKLLKYFGSGTCPHSMKGSRAYNIIKDFEDAHADITVQYYWSGGNNMEEFKKANAMYVPTITNGNYNIVELKLPDNTDTSKYNDIELKNLLLTNIYNQI
jgi:hypothetical protein